MGCSDTVIQKGIAAVVLVSAVLVLWYVSMFARDIVAREYMCSATKGMREHMCGGADQQCPCSGNETFIA
jgi:NO-binding membrane sensor protein with MHYT domain